MVPFTSELHKQFILTVNSLIGLLIRAETKHSSHFIKKFFMAIMDYFHQLRTKDELFA